MIFAGEFLLLVGFARRILDPSLVPEWMTLCGLATLDASLIRMALVSRLLRSGRLCRLRHLVHPNRAVSRRGGDSGLLRMEQ